MLQLIDNPGYTGYICDRDKLTVSVIKFNDRSLYTELFELDYEHPLERRRFELQYRLTTPLLDIPIEHGVRQFSVVKKGLTHRVVVGDNPFDVAAVTDDILRQFCSNII